MSDRHTPERDAADGPAPVCEEDPYPLYEPGTYHAQCTHAYIYRDPQFRRRIALLEFRLVPTGEKVCGFFNLGQGDEPKAGPRSKYWRAWVIANGAKPRKRQVLSERVFKDKIFEVEVRTVEHSYDQREHPAAMQYSTVRDIISRRWP